MCAISAISWNIIARMQIRVIIHGRESILVAKWRANAFAGAVGLAIFGSCWTNDRSRKDTANVADIQNPV